MRAGYESIVLDLRIHAELFKGLSVLTLLELAKSHPFLICKVSKPTVLCHTKMQWRSYIVETEQDLIFKETCKNMHVYGWKNNKI